MESPGVTVSVQKELSQLARRDPHLEATYVVALRDALSLTSNLGICSDVLCDCLRNEFISARA
jgi:hypothetical protein